MKKRVYTYLKKNIHLSFASAYTKSVVVKKFNQALIIKLTFKSYTALDARGIRKSNLGAHDFPLGFRSVVQLFVNSAIILRLVYLGAIMVLN